MKGDGCYYFFAYDLEMRADVNVELVKSIPNFINKFKLSEKIKSIKWIDNGEDVYFTQEGDAVTITTTHQLYGEQLVIKVAKIEV